MGRHSLKKNILFITGTRADFGKQKSLMLAIKNHPDFNLSIFCTGMHLMSKYGYTVSEIQKAGLSDSIFHYLNQIEGESMDIILSNTISGISRYLFENSVDLIVVHGDRIEAMAGAIVGALRNILVAHIEGGEVSGTIDDLIRHSITKMAHLHYVANDTAQKRLIQLGENQNTIFNIGSPDIDIMVSETLPNLEEVKNRYKIEFENYAIVLFHPVTTEVSKMKENAHKFVKALQKSKQKYVLIYPNNDLGTEHIFEAYKLIENDNQFKIFPSLRFEYFLTLLKNSNFIIGNSSAGIHEAPFYGIPTIDIGSRQKNRFVYESIQSIDFDEKEILQAIETAISVKRYASSKYYGSGNSAKLFIENLEQASIWETNKQKTFVDLNFLNS